MKKHVVIMMVMLFVGSGCALKTGDSQLAVGFKEPGSAAIPDAPTSIKVIDSHSQLGIDVSQPRFAWIIKDSDRGESQSAYQIIVASSESNINSNIGDMWNSGSAQSSKQYGVRYNGASLSSRTQYWYKVKVWDKDGNASAYSSAEMFSTGFMSPSDWDMNTKWISWSADDGIKCPMFQREFSTSKTVKRAMVYICGLGHYELSINGGKVGDNVIDPGWTDYKDSSLYVTHDVTDMIQKGGNAIGVILGNGFYNNWDTTRWQHYVTPSYGKKKMLFELHIEYTDASTAKILSDASWKVTESPVVFSAVMGGEDYDARKEQGGWDQTGFNASAWQNATETSGPGGALVSQYGPPMKVQKVYSTTRVLNPVSGISVYDFGQNMSGLPVLKVSGTAGSQIKLSPAEYLAGNQHASGRVDQYSLTNGQDNMYYIYTCKGDGIETWSPKFTYTGYRYIEAEVISGSATIESMQSQFIYADANVAGEFTSSNNDYNKIYDLCLKAFQSNMASILTDCPHREKLGYIQCVHTLGPSHMYLYDVQTLLAKTAQDMRESVRPDGLIHPESPNYVKYWGGIWPAAEVTIVLAPWLAYQNYGDIKILEDNYDLMKQQISIIDGKCVNHIAEYCGGAVGDWGGANRESILTETGVFHAAINVMVKIATVLGNSNDAAFYSNLANAAKTSYNNRFFNSDKNYYNPGGDGPNALPLYWGFVPSGKENDVIDYIADYITNTRGGNFSAGEVTLGYLFQSLSRYGRNDVVELMIQQQDAPSYKNLIDRGATALTEFFDMRYSHNHCMFGQVIEWFYGSVAGISSTKPGYEEIRIKPYVGNLTSCNSSVNTIRGKVVSNWSVGNDGVFTLDVTIPANTTANISIPKIDYNEDWAIQESRGICWQNGAYGDGTPGITGGADDGKFITLKAGSGKYIFHAGPAELLVPDFSCLTKEHSANFDYIHRQAEDMGGK
jgi:alpha-L-rhamnosidase